MAGETTKTPSERMIERLEKRQARRYQVGRMETTFSRLGVPDPWSAAEGVTEGPFSFLSAAPYYAMLRRMFAADERREKRFSWLFSRTTGSIGTRFANIRVRPTSRRLASSEVGGGDLLLVRPETQQTPVEEPAAEVVARPRRERSDRRRDRSVRVARAVRQVGLSRATAPAPRRAAPETVLFHREPTEPRGLRAVPTQTARPARRDERGARAMIASLEAVVRSIPYTREAARVSALVADLRESAPETWPARIREVVREIDLTSSEVAAEIEASLPDRLARPMTVAVSRSPSAGEARPRGLRTVTSRSPMVRALEVERHQVARPADRVRSERISASRARSPRRVARSRGASVRRAAARLGGASTSAAGASEGATDGPPAPSPAIELDRLSARGSLRKMTGSSRSPVEEAAVLREPEAPETTIEPAVGSPRPRIVGAVAAPKAHTRRPASAHVAARLSSNAGGRWIESASRPVASRPAARRLADPDAASARVRATERGEATSPPAHALVSVLERVLERGDNTREVGLRPDFYQRLGLAAPAARPVSRPGAATPDVQVSPVEQPTRGLARLARSRQARDARETRFQSRHGEPRMRAASRRWPGEHQPSVARRASVIALDGMNLAASSASIETTVAEAATTVAVARASNAARPSRPQPVRAARPVVAPTLRSPASSRPLRSRIEGAPEAEPRASRAADRAGERLESVLASTSVTLRAIEKASGGRADPAVVERVGAALERIARAPLARGARAAAVRQALRELGPSARQIAAEVETASPASASPMAVASARSAVASSKLGLRPILGASPAMLTAVPEAAPVVADAIADAPVRKPAPRLTASPVARTQSARSEASRPPAEATKPRVGPLAPRIEASRPGQKAARTPAVAAAPVAVTETDVAPAVVPHRASTARAMERLIAAELDRGVGAQVDEQGHTPASVRAASRATLDRPSGQSLLPRVSPSQPSPDRVPSPRSEPARIVERARRGASLARASVSVGAPTQVLAQPLGAELVPAQTGAPTPASREQDTELRAPKPRLVRAAVRAAERAAVGTATPGSTLPAVTPRRAIEALRTRVSRELSFAPPTLVKQPDAASEAAETVVAGREPARRAAFYSAASRPEQALRTPTTRPERAAPVRPTRLPALESRATTARPHEVQSVRALARMARAPVVAQAAARVLGDAPEAQLSLLREVAAHGPAAYARSERAAIRRGVGGSRRLPVGAEGVFATVMEPMSPPVVEAAPARRAPALGRPLDWMGDRAAASPGNAPKPGASTPARAERSPGVVELLREARAVQELVRSLSRAPVGASRAARLGPVAAARLIASGADRADVVSPRDAARLTRKILGDAFQVLAGGQGAAATETIDVAPVTSAALSRVAIRGDRAVDVSGHTPRISRRVLGDVVNALARAVAGAAEASAEAAGSTPAAGRRLLRRGDTPPLSGSPGGASAPVRAEPIAARRYVETPRRERRPSLDEVYAAPFRADAEAETEPGRSTRRRDGAPSRDLGRTLGAVEDGHPGAELPIWAQRAAGGSRVNGNSGGLLETLARAKEPADVIRAIERGESSLRGGVSRIPAPVLRLLDEIRAEAGEVANVEAQAALEGATGQTVNTVSQERGTRARGARATSRVYHGYTNLNPTRPSMGVDGLGPDRLMKLVRRLQQLIFLADGQRDDALRQVRLAEDSAAARSEGQAAPTQAGDSRSKQVDIEALAHDVLDKVHEIQESRGQRRLDDPDNRSVWW